MQLFGQNARYWWFFKVWNEYILWSLLKLHRSTWNCIDLKLEISCFFRKYRWFRQNFALKRFFIWDRSKTDPRKNSQYRFRAFLQFFFSNFSNLSRKKFHRFPSKFYEISSLAARLGRILAFLEEKSQKFVDRAEKWFFENRDFFAFFL